MTDTIVPGRALARSDSRYFYFQMSLVCMAVAFLGFWPSYWGRMVAGTLHEAPVSHLHGIIFFGWSLYIVYQSWLGASGQIARHRAVGLIGVSLATAMVIFGVMVSIQVMHELAAKGRGEYGVTLVSISMSNIALFAGLIVFALMNIRRPEWHKRLMLMGTIAVTEPGFTRIWGLTLWARLGEGYLPFYVSVYIGTLALVIAVGAYDLVTRRRLHPAYIAAALWIFANEAMATWLFYQPFWLGWMKALTGHGT